MSGRRCPSWLAVGLVACLVASGCSLPRHKVDQPVSKVAATTA